MINYKMSSLLRFSTYAIERNRNLAKYFSSCASVPNKKIVQKETFRMNIPARSFAASLPLEKQNPSLPNLEPKGQETSKTTVKTKLFGKLFFYIKGYEKILEKLLPDVALKFYKVFSNGTTLLFTDMKEFLWVHHVLSSTYNWEQACKTMTRKQLELYLTLPAELIRVAPVLVISAFPMAQNVAFPLALWAPKWLLSSHFWSDQIKKEVIDDQLKRRQSYYIRVFRNMIGIRERIQVAYSSSPRLQGFLGRFRSSTQEKRLSQSSSVHCDKQDDTHRIFKTSMQTLLSKSGQHPSVQEISAMAPYFQNSNGPLSLPRLSAVHVRYLLRIHNREHVGLTSFWFPRRKLQVYANMILQIDRALHRENIDDLDINSLFRCCEVRGLNTNNASEQEARDYLDKWISVTNQLNSDTPSLLLHLPIFLGYNHKSRYLDDRSVR